MTLFHHANDDMSHCEARTHVTVRWGEHRPAEEFGQFAGKCDACGKVVSAHYRTNRSTTASVSTNVDTIEDFVNTGRSMTSIAWYPQRGLRRTIDDVPEPIKSFAEEAHEVASIDCYRSAILLARSVVEATAKHHGIATGNLLQKIDALAEKNIIRKVIASAAHEVRHAGNDMAHGDFDVEVTREDADALLSIMDMVLGEVFQVESLIDRLRSKRQND